MYPCVGTGPFRRVSEGDFSDGEVLRTRGTVPSHDEGDGGAGPGSRRSERPVEEVPEPSGVHLPFRIDCKGVVDEHVPPGHPNCPTHSGSEDCSLRNFVLPRCLRPPLVTGRTGGRVTDLVHL